MGTPMKMYELDKEGRIILKDGDPIPRIGHTINPVPVYMYAPSIEGQFGLIQTAEALTIRNIAATALNLMG
jgi:hypothetical protein